ncbi:MAG: PKD domain-containing protein, partial [Propionicimonas sp.]
ITAFKPTFTGAARSIPGVNAMVLSPTGDRLVVGGNFITLNGSRRPGYGLGMITATTGSSLPLPVNDIVRNAGRKSAILALATDGSQFYGSGYKFGRGTGGNFEGTFSANWSNGAIRWLEDCHGDTYGVYPSSTAVYIASHSHYCRNVGGFGETDPPKRALAFSKAPTGVLAANTVRRYKSFAGQPAPSLLNFFPTLVSGKASGQGQAAWAVTGSGRYVVYAGEFLSVNGTPQQGLVRLATHDIAPNLQGPKASAAQFTPTLTSPAPGRVRVAWTADFDYDNSNLVYTVIRDNAPTPIATIPRSSTWWSRPAMTFTDTGVSAGPHNYRLRVTDPFGNAHLSSNVSVHVLGPGNQTPIAAFTTMTGGHTLNVDGRISHDLDGTIASYAWKYGDALSGTGATAIHVYAADGTYTITLTVTDNSGAMTATSQTVNVALRRR